MWKFLPTGLKHTHLSSRLTARTQQCHNYTLSDKSKFLNVGKSTSVKNTTSRKPSLFVPCKRKPEPRRVQLLRAGGIATQHRVDPFFLYPLTTHPYSIFSHHKGSTCQYGTGYSMQAVINYKSHNLQKKLAYHKL